MRGTTRTEGYHTAVFSSYVLAYHFHDVARQINAAIRHILENTGIDFLLTPQRGQFKFVLRRIIALGDTFQTDLGTQIGFHR